MNRNRNQCRYSECQETVNKPHLLCAAHWLLRFEKNTVKCPVCGDYRHKDDYLCETCRQNRRNIRSRTPNQGVRRP